MKKILAILPLLLIATGCSTDTRIDVEPQRKEYNVFENTENVKKANAVLKTVEDKLEKCNTFHVDTEMKNTAIAVNLDMKTAPVAQGQASEQLKVKAAIENFGFKSNTAVTGFVNDNGYFKFALEDLDAYSKVTNIGGKVNIDYKLPKSLYEDNEVADYIAQEGKLNVSFSNMSMASYMTDGDFYFDISDSNLYALADEFLNSGFLKMFPKQEEKYSSFKKMAELITGYNGKVRIIPDFDTGEDFNFGSTTAIPTFADATEEELPLYQQLMKEYKKNYGLKVYSYTNNEKYAFGVELKINKSTLKNIVNSLATTDFNTLLKTYGVSINAYEYVLTLRLCYDGSFEIVAHVNNDVSVNLPAEIRKLLGFSSFKLNFKAKTDFKLSCYMDNKFDELPSFNDYKDWDVFGNLSDSGIVEGVE